MRNRLIEKLTKSKKGSFGYTMTELLVVIAIIAIMAAIAIPSIIAISRALKFKRLNDHAKSIFMAAQQNLTDMRSDGELKLLQSEEAAGMIIQSPSFPEEFSNEYVYTTSQATGDAFELILPVGSVEGSVRSENIIIEYNPITGNVYSVFYYEDDEDIFAMYADPAQDLPRNAEGDKEERKDMMLGYYDGSGLNSSQLEIEKMQATVEFVNGEEGIVRVLVPIPEDYYGNIDEYAKAMSIELRITSERNVIQTAAAVEGETEPAAPAAAGFTLRIKEYNEGLEPNRIYVEDGKTLVVEYPIDSLTDTNSFANYSSNTYKTAKDENGLSAAEALTNLMDESRFTILPGENVTIQADVEVETSGIQIQVDSGILSNVNPMFDSLRPDGGDGYVLAVSNGRNLQNLNAIAPTIADKVTSVVFTSDIYWNDTVAYYNDKYGEGDGLYSNAGNEAPAKALPYFVPIHNEYLFGTARFIFPGDETDGGLGSLLDQLLQDIRDALSQLGEFIFGGFNNPKVPTLTDEMDAISKHNNPEFGHAVIAGNGYKVYNLNINANAYDAPAADMGKFYATGPNQVVDYYFTGLFGYVNTPIDNLHVVNPIIKGHAFDDGQTPVYKSEWSWTEFKFVTVQSGYANQYNNPATGALVGACGYNTVITNCSTYIDTGARGYISAYMYHGDFNASAEVPQKWYGVSGEGAVGGLVGYAKSHRAVNGALTGNKAHIAFSYSFAAVPVSGNMRSLNDASTKADGKDNEYGKDFGYSNGVGAFIGNSQLTNFYNCYASGDVKANNSVLCQTRLGNAGSWIRNRLTGTSSQLLQGVMDAIPELLYNGRTSWGAGGFVGTSHGTCYTNCFATGDVSTTCNVNNRGAGGFVGFMSLDETSAYGNEALGKNGASIEGNDQIAQRTVFSSCYAVGLSTSGQANENFSGGDGRIVYDLSESLTYLYGDYYLTYAHTYHEYGSAPAYGNSSYFYKDTYYLNYGRHTAETVSTKCGKAEGYETLQDLLTAHTYNSDWAQGQLTELYTTYTFKKRDGLIDTYWLRTYKEGFFDVYGGLRGAYLTAYSEGYSADAWEPATQATTHSYSHGVGSVYPFTKLKGLDYYGDWPNKPSEMGMAYYEEYVGEPDSTYFVFDKERPGVNQRLALTDEETAVVSKDGYAIFSVSQSPLSVSVNGKVFNNLTKSEYEFGIENKRYYAFILPDEVLEEAEKSDDFFVKVTAWQNNVVDEDGNVIYFIMYFNPGVAMSHVNPAYQQTVAAQPTSVPTTMYVRSARQFKYLSQLEDYWGNAYQYVQQLDIDAAEYQWKNVQEDVKLDSIGSSTKPFNALYNAGYTLAGDVARQHIISGFQFSDDASGVFGVIGEQGSVENLVVECAAPAVGSAAMADAAVLAARNLGSLLNVDLEITGTASVTAETNAGLLAGYSSGIIRNCDVSAGAVTLKADNCGGAIGFAKGTEKTKAVISNCTVSLSGKLIAKDAVNVGGMLGCGEYADISGTEPMITMTAMEAEADYAGGLAGWLENSAVKITDSGDKTTVELNGTFRNNDGYMAGVLGGGENVTVNGLDVRVKNLTGLAAAGFLGTGTNVNASYSAVSVVGGEITGEEAAAGVAVSIGAQSKFNYIPVELRNATVQAASGDAAGYAVEIARDADVQNAPVILEDGLIQADNSNAAGFAVTVSGYVGNSTGSTSQSSVVGTGTIDGKNAAGFACEVNGQLGSCFVTPALSATKEAYLGNSNDNLQVIGSETAAGFALTVGKDGSVPNCYALARIESPDSAGFVRNNKGVVDGCMANVTIPVTGKASAFITSNEGTVTRCYGWFADGQDTAATAVTATVDGRCFSAYFAELDPVDELGNIVTLYDASGNIMSMTAAQLQGAAETLAGEDANYKWYSSTRYDSFPYKAKPASMPKYLFPMLRNHYGEWIMPPQYAYGVAYYETYEAAVAAASEETGETTGTTTAPATASVMKLHLEDLSDPLVTKEGQSLTGYLTVEGGNVTVSAADVFTNDGQIAEAGYLVFCKSGENMVADYAAGSTPVFSLELTTGEKTFTYDFFAVKEAADGVLNIGASAVSSNTAAVNTYFADAINVSDNTYEVRTPAQLAKIGTAPTANFSQTHDIAVSDFTNVPELDGNYTGNGLTLKVTGQQTTWITTVGGSVTGLNLDLSGGVNVPVFGAVNNTVNLSGMTLGTIGEGGALATTVAGIMTVPDINTTVNGTLFGDSTGTINTGAITVSGTAKQLFGSVGTVSVDGDIGITGTDVLVFGAVNTSISAGSIQVTGSAEQVFGDVNGATVNTGAISVTGNASQVFGNVASSANKITVASIETGSVGNVFGTVGAPVEVTGGIDTGALSGQVFGAVSANVTVGGINADSVTKANAIVAAISSGDVKLGTVTVSPAADSDVPALIGAVSGKLYETTFDLAVYDTSASLIASVAANASVEAVTVETDGILKAPVVGGDLGGTLKNMTVDIGSAEVNGAVLVAKVAQNATVEGCTVKASGTVTAKGDKFGILTAVNGGELKNNTISDGAGESLALTVNGENGKTLVVGGLVGENTGKVAGGTVDVAITYAQSNEKNENGEITATDKGATIGGLVGENSGDIGKDKNGNAVAVTVNGSVELSKLDDGVREYIIGGAVGKANGGTYTGVTADVELDGAWAGSWYYNNGNGIDVSVISPAQMGPVGKFVGYISTGTFTNCAGNAEAEAYQFVGQLNAVAYTLTAHDAANTDWFSAAVNNAALSENANGTDSVTLKPAYASYSRVDDGTVYYNYDGIVLDGCTFRYNDSSEVVYQKINTIKYFYNGLETNVQNYSTSRYGSLTAEVVVPTWSQLHPSYSAISGDYEATNYYYHAGNGVYYKVYVKSEWVTREGKYRLSVAYKNGSNYVDFGEDKAYAVSSTARREFEEATLYQNVTAVAFTANNAMFLIADSSGSEVLAMNADGSVSAVDFAKTFDTKNSIAKGIWQVSGGTWQNVLTPGKYLTLSGSNVAGASKALTVGSASYTSDVNNTAWYTIKGDSSLNYTSGNFTLGNASNLTIYEVSADGDPYWNGDFSYASLYDQRCVPAGTGGEG